MSDGEMRFTASEYAALLKWKMASDPWPVDYTAKAHIEDMLNEEAWARGYEDWVAAYHDFGLGETDE